MRSVPRLWLLLLLLVTPLVTFAAIEGELSAESSGEAEEPVDEEPIEFEDKLMRDTPRHSLEGFLQAADDDDYELAAEFLDMRNLRGRAAELSPDVLALGFEIVLERGLWVDLDELSDEPDGIGNDELPEWRDILGVVELNGRETELYMQRVPHMDHYVWKVSNKTVQLVPDLYEQYGYDDFTEAVYRAMPEGSFMGLEYFKWAISLGTGVIAYIIVVVGAWIFTRLAFRSNPAVRKRIFRFFVVPFGFTVVVVVLNNVSESLGYGLHAQLYFRGQTLTTIGVVWVLINLTGFFRDFWGDRLERQGREGAKTLLSPATNAINLFIVLFALLVWLQNLGVNITTLLAGLGVGGIAMALALQKPLEDIFGALWLYTLQPIRVGDFCRIGPFLGTVEEIGLRRCRVRTLANTVVAIPNSKVADEAIDNISARQRIWYNPTLRLRYDTNRATMEKVLELSRAILDEHPRVLEGSRCRFKEIHRRCPGGGAVRLRRHNCLRRVSGGGGRAQPETAGCRGRGRHVAGALPGTAGGVRPARG